MIGVSNRSTGEFLWANKKTTTFSIMDLARHIFLTFCMYVYVLKCANIQILNKILMNIV
jgi:hypothetical protein